MKKETKRALLIGFLGVIWFKVIEWYVQVNTGVIKLTASVFFSQLIWTIILSSIIITIFYFIFKKAFYMSFVPMVWYLIKDFINIIFGAMDFKAWLISTLPESILIGIPIGLALYYVVGIKKLGGI